MLVASHRMFETMEYLVNSLRALGVPNELLLPINDWLRKEIKAERTGPITDH